MQQLRPYNQSQTHLAYRRTSWGLQGLDYNALDPIQAQILGQLMTSAQTPSDEAIMSGAITTPANVQPATPIDCMFGRCGSGTGVPSGVMWVAIGFIVAMGMGLFDGPKRYGR